MLMDPTSYDDFRRMQILRAVREVGVDKEKIKRIEKLLAMLEPATEPHSKKDKSKPISIEAALNIPSEGDMEVRGIGRDRGGAMVYQYHIRKNGRWNQVDGTRALNPADCPEKPTKGHWMRDYPTGKEFQDFNMAKGPRKNPQRAARRDKTPTSRATTPYQQADAVREQGTNPIDEQGTDPIRHRPPRTPGPQGGRAGRRGPHQLGLSSEPAERRQRPAQGPVLRGGQGLQQATQCRQGPEQEGHREGQDPGIHPRGPAQQV